MTTEHSLSAYLERQNTEKLELILLQELKKESNHNSTLILKILYILETRDEELPSHYPPHIMKAWNRYLHRVSTTLSDKNM